MARYGYMLLDRHDQDVGRQAMQLDTIGGFDRIFVDRMIREHDGREQRERLLAALKPGDVVYAAAVDRFCVHLRDFLQVYTVLRQCGADLVLLEENFDSRSPAGRQTLRVLGSFDKLDFTYQSDRKKAGIRKARDAGRRIGRPPVSIPPGFREICKAWSQGQLTGREAAARSGLRSTSFYKKAAELGFKAPPRKPGPSSHSCHNDSL